MRTLEQLIKLFSAPLWVALSEIVDNAKNPRLDLDLAKSFIQSFEGGYRLEEGPVYLLKVNGKFRIISGHRRFNAMQEATKAGKLKIEDQRMWGCVCEETLTDEEEMVLLAWGNAQTNKGKVKLDHTESLIMVLQLPASFVSTASETAIGQAIGLDRKSSSFAVIQTAKVAKLCLGTGIVESVLENLRAKKWVSPIPSSETVAFVRALETEPKDKQRVELLDFLSQKTKVEAASKALGKVKLEDAAKACPSQFVADLYRNVAQGVAQEVTPALARLIDACNKMSNKERDETEEYLKAKYPGYFATVEAEEGEKVSNIAAHAEKGKGKKGK